VDLPVGSIVERLVGLQAQVPRDPYVSLWSRVRGFRLAELEAMLLDRRAHLDLAFGHRDLAFGHLDLAFGHLDLAFGHRDRAPDLRAGSERPADLSPVRSWRTDSAGRTGKGADVQ
jgi:hypothetical protein